MKDKRIIGFILLFLLAGAAVGYAAIPQNTFIQNQGGTMPTFNATVEYYRGALNYTAWLLTKVGAVGGWPVFDQDLNTTDSVEFDDVNVTDNLILGDVSRTTWPSDTNFDQDLNTTSDVEFTSTFSANWTIPYPEGLANNATTGIYIKGQAGEALNFGDACYLELDGDYMKSDSNSSAKMFVVAIAAEKMENAEIGHFLIEGYIRCDSWDEMIIGSAEPILAGWIPGTITQDMPDTAGDQVQRIGYPVAAKIIRFDPDSTVVEIA